MTPVELFNAGMESVLTSATDLARMGTPFPELVVVAIQAGLPMVQALQQHPYVTLKDGSVAAVVDLQAARDLVSPLSPQMAARLDGPLGESESWGVALTLSGGMVQKIVWTAVGMDPGPTAG